ncbi:unnamed protein product [Musa acuminata subsp. malaccensis]|uniref:(wild Malaysian banana) hypothetical protein n=1 Tax=Musa acuminata subsp. malaccensis TaxID=214687 RepID=A0A804JF13_MUSAM|nr:unnamed protein product [Musa acuminata subsp. malaccensis]
MEDAVPLCANRAPSSHFSGGGASSLGAFNFPIVAPIEMHAIVLQCELTLTQLTNEGAKVSITTKMH